MPIKKKKKVKFEIERKFLLKNIPIFGKRKWSFLDIRQFYFNRKEDGKRVRYREAISDSGKIKYYSTQKDYVSEGTNAEDEFEITSVMFWKKFKETSNKRMIEKQRFIYNFGGHKFEIDRFIGMHIIILEVELKNINEKISFPDFIKKEIIVEVTKTKEFGNYSLSSEC